MHISHNWLTQYIDLPEPPQQVAETLTMIGLEVEGMETRESIPGGLRGLVIGKILGTRQHPNADRLKLCEVDLGQENPAQIVCGAPNVATGQKVPVAVPGTTLYDKDGNSLTIKKSKLRGEKSEGMICAEDEIGLGEGHDGIMVLDTDLPPGTALRELITVKEDTVYEIGLTPNRTDAMCHYGVARDLSAALNRPLKTITIPEIEKAFDNPVQLTVTAKEEAPRYCGRVLRNLQVKESPQWLKDRLEAVGQRPINNVVDVTNYVLLGMGQPLHAFDLSKIEGNQVVVRQGRGESFTTLDDRELTLGDTDVVIANENAPMCIAGVMGGAHSGTTEATTAIFLESAYFSPDAIRSTATRLGLKTETSYRFERGTDPDAVRQGLDLATQLILELAGGEASDVVEEHSGFFEVFKVKFRFERTRLLSGEDISDETQTAILERLGIRLMEASDRARVAFVPLYRADVQREQDLIEEILRIYGFNNISPGQKLHATPDPETDQSGLLLRQKLSDRLASMGLNEILTNPLVPKSFAGEGTVDMLNPLSEENAVLRPQLLPSGLEAIAWNLNRQQKSLRFFEFGKTYHGERVGKYSEDEKIGLWFAGENRPLNPHLPPEDFSIFELRAVVEQIGQLLGHQLKFSPIPQPSDFGLSYGLLVESRRKSIGFLGKVPRETLEPYDIEGKVFYAELDWHLLRVMAELKDQEYTPIPKTPRVRRDLSLELEPEVTFAEIETLIRKASKNLVKSVELFDVYTKLEGGKKSYAVAVTLHDPNQTLNDKAIDKTMQKAVNNLEATGRIKLRGEVK